MKKTYLAIALATTILFTACGTGTSSNTADSTTSTSMSGDSSTMNADPNSTASSTGSDTGSMAMSSANATPLNDMDKQFAMDAAKGGNTEVQASQAALSQAQNDRVKSFAQMMVDDHTKANGELKSLVSPKGVTLSDSADPKKLDALQSLKKMNGASFDKQYMTMMVKDHKETVDKFQMASEKCADSELKTWAAGKLPALKMHLDSAQAIQKALK